jgi:hypothetical protein
MQYKTVDKPLGQYMHESCDSKQITTAFSNMVASAIKPEGDQPTAGYRLKCETKEKDVSWRNSFTFMVNSKETTVDKFNQEVMANIPHKAVKTNAGVQKNLEKIEKQLNRFCVNFNKMHCSNEIILNKAGKANQKKATYGESHRDRVTDIKIAKKNSEYVLTDLKNNLHKTVKQGLENKENNQLTKSNDYNR